MSSLFLLRLLLNLPVVLFRLDLLFISVSLIYAACIYACSGFQFMLMIKEEEKIESREEERKRKDFFNITGFPSFHN